MTLSRKLAVLGTATLLSAGFVGETFALEWNVSLWGKRRAFTEHVEKLAELVSAKTNGEFTLNLAYGEALSKSRENLDGISIGAFEMAQFCASYHADKNPTLTVLELPFLGVPDLKTQVMLDKAVYAHPAVEKDLARWNAKLLMSSPMPQYNFVGKGDAPTKVSDFEGMRVRALGGIGKAMETIGAVPTTVTASETFQAIDSGTVRAASFAPHAHLSFKTVEAGNWWTTNLNPGTVNCPVVVNKDAYDALPENYREALDSSVDEAIDHYLATYDKVYEKWYPTLEELKIEQVTFPKDQLAAFKEKAGKPLWDAWVVEMDGKGIPGQELLDLVQSKLN
ncbi:C4-dicarboxylate TRAP transporter substrate-binding protein [Stappia taiwanensis]|uniref:C4-dicarboxylate TRAP transporter substrate-binding protein n=1 Tax=Stappia taiwanensis TaxID=992267 RepID=A0A838XYK2_9HYPH|nr:C4-dicarboxylate TRAP transporter substrate-binding protein [Stappia taiwanensis]MBA4612104.1 C4-dicarboxylate TRAP transporter substrate-binding protein [Stappia taiwanensis]GGE91063.1 ABC transporter substrate-binding protein [Stappia taiwanensis]